MPTTRAYVDGFNLYHGIIAPNRLHWLDLNKLAVRLNRGQPVEKIIYCTAMVSSTPSDPDKTNRQDIYLRALRMMCPNVEIILGKFRSHEQLRALAGCAAFPPCAIRVVLRSEKGTDVNLASRLLHDAHLNKFDRALVVSGDSDLAETIRLVVSEVSKEVLVRNPRNKISHELESVATEYSCLRVPMLRDCQFPQTVTNGMKTYTRPARWGEPRPEAHKTIVLSVPCPNAGCKLAVTTCRYV